MKMNRYLNLVAGAAACGAMLMSCGGDKHGNANGLNVVDVIGAIDKPAELTTSQLGSQITFVPLETTDSTLIGDVYKVEVTNDKAIVFNLGSNPGVMVFDLNTGAYLNNIGRIGGGPGEYKNPYGSVDKEYGRVYFQSNNSDGYIVFDTEGNQLPDVMKGHRSYEKFIMAAIDSTLYVLDNSVHTPGDRSHRMLHIGLDGAVKDTVVMFDGQSGGFFPNGFSGYTDYRNYPSPLRHSNYNMHQVTNNDKTYAVLTEKMSQGTDYLFNEMLCDTVYSLVADNDLPVLVFNTGDHAFTPAERNNRDLSTVDIVLTDFVENQNHVVFTVSRGWPGDDSHKEYIGIYDRKNGTTVMASASEGIRDDLGGFVSFAPFVATPKGDLVGVLDPSDIDDWMEAHPDSPVPDALKNRAYDDNPVLVIVSR